METDFGIYEFDISITLRRKDGVSSYQATNLVKFETKQEKPLLNDRAAQHELREMVDAALDTSTAIVGERIEFEDNVRRLTAGGEPV